MQLNAIVASILLGRDGPWRVHAGRRCSRLQPLALRGLSPRHVRVGPGRSEEIN